MTPEAAWSPGDHRRALKVFAFIALVGPLLGAITYMIPFVGNVVYTSLTDQQAMDDGITGFLKTLFGMLILVTVFGYALGAFAALLCAIVAAIVVYRYGDIRFWQMIAIGIVAGIVGGLLMGMTIAIGDGTEAGGFSLSLVVPSIVAAALGWFLMRKFGWVGQIAKPSFTKD